MKKDLLIIVSGGVGQNIARTAITKELKEKYNDIYVVSPYSDIWQTQDLAGVYNEAPASIYQQLIKGTTDNELEIIPISPYETTMFINKSAHFLDAYRSLFGLPLKGVEGCMNDHVDIDLDRVAPEISNEAKQIIDDLLKEHNKKDVCLIQSCGGSSPLTPQQINPEVIVRNYRYMQDLVKLEMEKHPDTLFLQYKLPAEPAIEGCASIDKPYLFYRALAQYCKNAIVIDSSLAHIIEGKLKANVIWLETSEKQFGWASHNNIKGAKNDLDVEPLFSAWHCPPSVIRFKSAEELDKEIIWND